MSHWPGLGDGTLGVNPLGGDPLHDPPSVTVTAPTGTVSTGGPLLTINWNYTHPQADPQTQFRVRILTDLLVEIASTGFIVSGAETYAFDIDANEVPAQDDLVVEVTVRDPAGQEASDGQAFTLDWGDPQVTIDAPLNGSVHTDPASMLVDWTFTDDAGHTQSAYRVRFLAETSDFVIFTTGWIASSDTSKTIDFAFQSNQTIRVEVQAKNQHGIRSGNYTPEIVTVFIQLSAEAALAVAPLVGTQYDVAINGHPYRLRWDPDRQFSRQRGAIPLNPERLATTDTPFSEAIDRYTFQAYDDFHSGAGQRLIQRDDSVNSAYYRSEHVNPFVEGEVTLLHDVDQSLVDDYANIQMVTVGDTLYVLTAADELKYTSNGTSYTTISGIDDGAGATTILDLTSDGVAWYAATGRSIMKSVTTDPGAAWSAVEAVKVMWAADRIMATRESVGSAADNELVTVNAAGLEDDILITLPVDTHIHLGGVVGGFFYFCGANNVYSWQLGGDPLDPPAPVVAWQLPEGLDCDAVGAFGGSVWIRTTVEGAAQVYRGIPGDDGSLTPFLVTDIPDTGEDTSIGTFASYRDEVFFTWSNLYAGETGCGAINLVSGGWAKWISAPVEGLVNDLTVWQGRIALAVQGEGVYIEDPTEYRLEGTIDTSISDSRSLIDKMVDAVYINSAPLGAAEEIEVLISFNSGLSYTSIGTLFGAGTTRRTFDVDESALSVGLRLRLVGDGTSTPTFLASMVQLHPFGGLVDTILILPIHLQDKMKGLNDAAKTNPRGWAAREARYLEGLAHSVVSVQDIDYHLTGHLERFEVDSVQQVEAVSVSSNQGASLDFTIQVTLRKRGT